MKTKQFPVSRAGFTLVELMIVVAILGLLVGLAVPNFIKSRSNAQKQLCIENLSQIEAAKQMWGVEVGKKDGDPVTGADIIGVNSYLKKDPVCPGGGDYDYKPIGVTATCTKVAAGHTL